MFSQDIEKTTYMNVNLISNLKAKGVSILFWS